MGSRGEAKHGLQIHYSGCRTDVEKGCVFGPYRDHVFHALQ